MLMRVLIVLLAAVSFSAQAATDEAIAERIKPLGEVCVEGNECANAAPAAAPEASAGGARSGEEIYNASCAACHGAGIAGAPKFGDAAAWAPRLSQGMETVVANAINGLNAMPPRGTCGACSDDEIAATVQYMADNAK